MLRTVSSPGRAEPGRADPPRLPKVAELVEAARGGDQLAFRRLVDRHRSLVFSVAFSLTGSLTEAEELAQETFVRGWSKLAELRRPERFSSWICAIARNASLQAVPLRARSVDLGAELPSPDPSPLDRVISHEEETVVRKALGAIPEAYRVPLVLFYQEQESMETVAEALDLSVDNVRQRLSRGRRMIRENLLAIVESVLSKPGLRNGFTAAVMAMLAAGMRSTEAAAGAGAAGSKSGSKSRSKSRSKPGRPPLTRALVGSAVVGTGIVLSLAGVWYVTRGAQSPPHPAGERRPWALKSGRLSPALGLNDVHDRADKSRPFVPSSVPVFSSHPRVARRLLDFDFEDGLLPDSRILGETAVCPSRPGNAYCLVGEVQGGFLHAGFATREVVYSSNLILSFDYWVTGERIFQVQISDPDSTLADTQYFVNIDHPTKGAWAHREVPFRNATERTGHAMKAGDRIVSFTFVFAGGYQPNQALYVDNVSMFEEVSP